MINGELDMLTTPAEGDIVTAQYKNAKHVIIANSFHVDALEDVDDCTQEIIRRFVSTLDTGDTSCAANVKPGAAGAELHAARGGMRFQLLHPNPATPRPAAQLAQISAAVQTAGDVIARWNINYTGNGPGLRGGTWTFTQGGDFIANFTMTRCEVDRRSPQSPALRNGTSTTARCGRTLRSPTPTANRRSLDSRIGNDRDHDAVATLTGTIGFEYDQGDRRCWRRTDG